MIALLTSEALQVVNVGPRAHHHLESWNNFAARCAVTGISEKSVKSKKKTHVCYRYSTYQLYTIFSYVMSSQINRDILIITKYRHKI